MFQEQKETEIQLTQYSEKMKSQDEVVAKLEEELKKNSENVEELEKKIKGKNSEMQDHIKDVSRKSNGMGILAALVPFIGPIIKSIYDTTTAPGDAAQTQALDADLTRLNSEKSIQQNKEWAIQVNLMGLQLQLASSRIQLGERLSHELALQHLKEFRQNTDHAFYKFIRRTGLNGLESEPVVCCLSRCDSQSCPSERRPSVSFSNPADSASASEVLGESGISAGHAERQDLC